VMERFTSARGKKFWGAIQIFVQKSDSLNNVSSTSLI
jgi:hypothetical protein